MIRAFRDNVVLLLEPLEHKTASGISIIEHQPKHRTALVLSSGPGYYLQRRVRGSDMLGDHTEETAVLVPNQTRPGDRVLIDALAGQHYVLDVSVPRHNKETIFDQVGGERGEFRIVREQEILGVLEDSS